MTLKACTEAAQRLDIFLTVFYSEIIIIIIFPQLRCQSHVSHSKLKTGPIWVNQSERPAPPPLSTWMGHALYSSSLGPLEGPGQPQEPIYSILLLHLGVLNDAVKGGCFQNDMDSIYL